MRSVPIESGPGGRQAPVWRGLVGVILASTVAWGACSSDKVSSVEVTSVTVRPAETTMVTGDSRRMSVDIRDQDGNVVPSTIVTWSASPASVVAVDETGLVEAIGPGTGTVRATAQGVTGSAAITVEPPPTIGVDPAIATLAGLLGGTPPPEPVTVEILNTGSGTLGGLVASVSYAQGEPSGWLSPALAGTTAPTELVLAATATGLDVGEYSATVTLSSSVAANSPLEIPVRLRVVTDQPVIRANPSLVGFSGVSGGPRPPEQMVTVENIGGGSLDDLSLRIDYGAMPGWLTATLSGASAPADLTLEVNPAPLLPGPYEAQVQLLSSTAINSPKAVVVSFNVEALADVRVTKIGPDSAAAGTRVTYALQLRNDGPSAAEDVVFTDTLPTNANLVSVPDGATRSGRVLTWNLGTLQAGTQRTFSVEVDIPSGNVGVLRNAAAAASPTPDPSPSSRIAVTNTSIVRASNLEAVKLGPDSVFAGREATYTLIVHNRGPSDAVSVVRRDSLPPNASLVSASDGGLLAGGVVTWPVLPALIAGDSAVVQATVSVAPSETADLSNHHSVASASRDPVSTNDSVTIVTPTVVYADLEAIAEAPTTIVAGTSLTLTSGVRNLGPSDAGAVVVTDTLPVGVSFVSATQGGVESGGVVTWPAIPVLAPGDSARYDVVVAVPASANGSLVHTSGVSSSTMDPGPALNRASAPTTVDTRADLNVAKRGPATDTAGTNANYTVVVRNDGPSDAPAVVVVDSLPAGAALVSASNGGAVASGVVTWPAVPVVAAGDSIIRTVTVTLDPARTGQAVNVARASSGVVDPDASDDRAAVTTALLTRSDLSITKTGPASGVAGQDVAYTITATNAGPSTATGVVVTDTLPAGVTFVSANAGGTLSSGVVTWPAVTLAPGATRQVQLTVRVGVSRTTPISNVAAVASSVTDPIGSDNRVSISTPIQVSSDVGVTVTGPATGTAGTNVTWTVRATNAGPSTATGVVVTDTLPTGVTFVSATGGGTAVGRVVTWPTVASLAPGASVAYSVTAAVGAGVTGALQNVGAATSASPDPISGNSRATRTTTIQASSDLSVTKTGAAVDTAGTTITWTVQATNAGPSTATGVVVSDTLPAGLTGVTASGGGTYSAVGNVVTWPTVSSLAVGGSTPAYTVSATIPGSATGSLTNRARVNASTTDPTSANDRQAVTTSVTAVADVSVAKTGAAVDTAGSPTTWTVRATNAGPSTATGVVLSDTLPPGVTGVTASGGGTYSAVGNVVTWPTVAALASGASTPTYTVTATIPASATGSITNRARVRTTSSDPTPGNDRNAVVTSVVALADLAVTKTGQAVDTAGTTTTWTVRATNTGPSVATGVVVSDTLPAGVTGVTASNGGTYSAIGNVVTWPTVASLSSGGSTPNYTVTATIPSSATGSLINRARVNAVSTDPTSANDRQSATTSIVRVADLSVTKVAPAVDTAGTTISWTVRATNAGPSSATGVVLSDTLPAGVTGVSATGGGVYSAVGNVVTWPVIASLASGASTPTYTVTATIPSSASGTWVNRARVRGTSSDPTPANDRQSANTTIVAAADLSVSNPGPAVDTAGTTITWTVQATNGGPSAASGVVVSDTLPAGATGVTASGGGTYSAVGNVVTWPTIASLASGASTPAYTVTATIPSTTTGSWVNRARVASTTPDVAPANDRSSTTTSIVAAANLAVAKTGPAVDTAGTTISWTVQASNIGPSAAAGVVVSDTLPPGATGVTASGGGTYSAVGNVVTWPTIASLAPGASSPVHTITATIPATTAGAWTNRARVVSPTADPATANDRQAVSTTIVAAADLSVTKTAPAVDTAGTTITWSVQATNSGPSAATAVVVSDTLPPGATGVTASNGGTYSAVGNVVTWPTIPSLASGASTSTYTVTATIPATTSGTWTNRARVASGTADPTPANNRQAAATTVVAAADLSMAKTGAAVDTAGTSATWTVRATNAGPSAAAGVVISDTLPPGVTGVVASNGGTYSAVGNVVTWPAIGSLASGASSPIYTVTATIPATATGSMTNRARVASSTADPTPANDRQSVSTTIVAAADLSVTKTAQAVDTAGTTTTWTVQASNSGPSTATGVVVSDTLPAGVTGVTASGGGTYSAVGNVVTWPTVASLASGASTPAYTVTATIPSTLTGSLTNRARVTASTADPTPANDRQATTTTVVAAADLSVTKTGQAADTAGTATTWTVQATNAGPSTATGVVVSDTLPAGVTGVTASNGGTYSAVGNVVTWPTVASLGSGASTPAYTVTATIPQTATGGFTNRARVSSPTADPTPANDRQATTTTVTAVADLSVAKTGQAVDTAGTATTWTVQATNAGPSAATAVVVSDTLPVGVTGVTASNGGTYSAVGNVVTWPTVASLASGASTPAYTVTATIPSTTTGSWVNRARVTSPTTDPTPANDRQATTTSIVASADLSVTKTGQAVDTAGTATTWTVQATNAGPSTATGVVVSDTLPAGATGVTASNGGTYSAVGNVVTWPTVASLAPGASTAAYTVTATIPATTTGSWVNRARVASPTTDPTPANDRQATTTTIVAAADLSVTKTGQAVDTAGTATTWTVQATNAGPSTATGVVVSDTLPAGVTGVTASNGGTYSAVGNVVTWPTVASLASGASTAAYTVTATIPGGTTGSLTNRARVASTSSDPTPANDRQATTTTVTAVADLSVTKTGQAVDTAGTATTWTVQATNAGPSTATGVVVSDTLPAGVTGVTASNGGTYSAVGNVVTWPTVASLASGASTAAYTVTATIPATATGALTNRARVASPTSDPTPANDRQATSTTLTAVADLGVTASAPATATAGSQITFTVSVANAGPSTATAVVVSDTLPTGVTFVSATGGGVHSAGVVTWPTIASITPGAAATSFDVVVDVNAGFSGTLANVAVVAGGTTDPTPVDNVSTSSTAVSTPAPVPEAPDRAPRDR